MTSGSGICRFFVTIVIIGGTSYYAMWYAGLFNLPDGDKIIILVWTKLFNNPFPMDKLDSCPKLKSSCQIVLDKSTLSYADAVVFHFGDIFGRKSLPANIGMRKSWQRYVFFSHESSAEKSDVIDLKSVPQDYFNWTMTMRLDSDIPWPYSFYVQRYSKIMPDSSEYTQHDRSVTDAIAKKSKVAAWMVSNCHTDSARETYVNALRNVSQFPLHLDVYGKCGNLTCEDKPGAPTCYEQIAEKYKFYFALENSVCEDYTTEKAFQSLDNFVVPVVLNRRIAEATLPPGSFIAIDDYASPAELATLLLALNGNDTAYAAYFDWKLEGLVRTDYVPGKGYGMCGMCELLLQNRNAAITNSGSSLPFKFYTNIDTWYYNKSSCDQTPGGYAAKLVNDSDKSRK